MNIYAIWSCILVALRFALTTLALTTLAIGLPHLAFADTQPGITTPQPTQSTAAQPAPAPDTSAKPKPPLGPPVPNKTNAGEGRYQAIALPRDPGSIGDKMMIVDTLTGDVWQWFDSPALSQYIGKTGITYMGKLKAGTAPGETVTFRRFDLK